jgi:hypothetical protein
LEVGDGDGDGGVEVVVGGFKSDDRFWGLVMGGFIWLAWVSLEVGNRFWSFSDLE